MDKEKLKEVLNKIPVLPLVLLYVAWGGYQFYEFTDSPSSPLTQKMVQIRKLKGENDKIRKKIQEAEKFYKSLDIKREEIRGLAKELGMMKATLSEELDMADLIKTLTTEAEKAGLKIEGITPGNSLPKEFYIEQRFEVKFVGFYFQTILFLERISQLRQILKVTDLKLQPRKQRNKKKQMTSARFIQLAGELKLGTYRYNPTQADGITGEKKGGGS